MRLLKLIIILRKRIHETSHPSRRSYPSLSCSSCCWPQRCSSLWCWEWRTEHNHPQSGCLKQAQGVGRKQQTPETAKIYTCECVYSDMVQISLYVHRLALLPFLLFTCKHMYNACLYKEVLAKEHKEQKETNCKMRFNKRCIQGTFHPKNIPNRSRWRVSHCFKDWETSAASPSAWREEDKSCSVIQEH